MSIDDSACFLLFLGFMALIFGAFFFAVYSSYIVIYLGVAMMVTGIIILIATHPRRKRENMKIKSIIDIVSVRRQTTITDICEETGLDREYVQQVIAARLISCSLHGYLEDDVFVRDTGVHRIYQSHSSDDSDRIMDDD